MCVSRSRICKPVVVLLFALATWQLASSAAHAKYPAPELENVPIDRLIKNLQERAEKDPKNVDVRFNLARVHAMAFAWKTDTCQVLKSREERGAWFGFEPAHVPFVHVKPTDDAAKLKAAKEHLTKAIGHYQEVIKLDPDHLAAKLGHAWCIQQSGDKDDAIKAYRQVIEDGWNKEKDRKFGPIGNRWITTEAADYLKPLLDPKKESDEIRKLDERVAELQKRPRAITPIVIPLRDGVAVPDLLDQAACVRFDADGSGLPQSWSWISKDAGWLVSDTRGTGRVTSALQMFGSVTYWLFWENGYHALGALDDNGDGLLTGEELRGLAIWHDVNGNGVSDAGEVKPLAAYGIVALSTRHETSTTHPDVIAFSRQGVIFRDGVTRATYDILLHRR